MKKYRFETLLILALAAFCTLNAATRHKSILSLKESITDSDIVFPYSFETNTHELMKNWYLENYAILDANVEDRSPATVSDAEYIKRLKAIPSGVELPFNQVVRSYIERYVTKNRTLVSQMLGMSPYYMPIFEQQLEKNGMPLELKYIPVIESALDPNAVSSAGATGLWQFMLSTAKGVGLEVNSLVDERRDPYRSSEKAAIYFKQLYNIYGDWSLAIAAYNCGPANVNKALRRAKSKEEDANPDFWAIYNYLPRETRGYVPAFIAATYVMNYYKEHNINPSLAKKPLLIDTVAVNRRINFQQIANVLNIPIEEIRILNPQYRHDVIPGDTHPYKLALPSQQIYSFIMVEDSIIGYRPELYATHDVREPGTSNETPTKFNAYDYSNDNTLSAAPSENSSRADNGDKRTTKYHKVQRGETLNSIAQDFNMSADELMSLNHMRRGRVRRGQVIKVYDNGGNASATADNDYADIKVVSSKTNGSGDVAQSTPPARKQETQSERSTFTPAPQASAAPDKPTVPAKKATTQATTKVNPAVPASTGTKRSSTPYAGSYSINDELEQKPDRATQRKAAIEAQKVAAEKRAADRKAKEAATAEQKAQTQKNREATTKGERNNRRNRRNKQQEKPIETTTTTVQVKPGQSLAKIAIANGVTVEELREANPEIKSDHIEAGQNIKIPVSAKAKNNGKYSGKYGGKRSDKNIRNKRVANNEPVQEKASTVTVKKGESLGKIANANGLTIEELREANPEIKGNRIDAGQDIKIPVKKNVRNARQNNYKTNTRGKRRNKTEAEPVQPTSIEVKEGESLEKIAKKNGTTVDELRKANPGIKGNHIEPGDEVKLPKKVKAPRKAKRKRK